MQLLGLRIENFRAIRKTTISFDEGTALIGENDCGISSVLDALELALGYDEKTRNFPPYLFHQSGSPGQPSGPIRIQLKFRERHKGEWQDADFAPFTFLLPENKMQRFSPGKIIQTAVRKQSKPFLALSIVEAIATEDSPGIPAGLREMIETCVSLARTAPSRLA